MLLPDDARRLFLDSGARLSGHFRLSSGRHSGEYWEKFRVLEHPALISALCGEIARRYAGTGIEVVLGPTTGGILLAFEVARQMGVRALYAEKETGERVLRRGSILAPGTRILIVDDVLTSGGAVRACLELAGRYGAEIVGVGVLIDRSGGQVDLGHRCEALLTVQSETYAAEDCPLCAQKILIQEPGTTFLQSV